MRVALFLFVFGTLVLGCSGKSRVRSSTGSPFGGEGGSGETAGRSGQAGGRAGGNAGGRATTGGSAGADVAGGEGGERALGGEGGSAGSPDLPECDPTLVYEGDVVAESDEDVWALAGFGVIAGSLSIIDGPIPRTDTVTDLSALRCLTAVEGAMTLDAPFLASVAGLENLTSVGESFRIEAPFYGGSSLDSLHGLERLASIGGNLEIIGMGLGDLDGLSGLREIGRGLTLTGNADLSNVDGLAGITELGGNLFLRGWCPEPEEPTYCRENEALNSIEGLRNLAAVSGSIEISQCPALMNVDGLRGLIRLDGGLLLSQNDQLSKIDGLSGLTHVARLRVLGNPALASLHGLQNLVSVETDVEVGRWVTTWPSPEGPLVSSVANTSLTDLDGLASLTTIGGYLEVTSNPALEGLRGLASLEMIGAHLGITSNPNLPTCEAEWLRDNVGIENIGAGATISGNGDGDCAMSNRLP